MNELEVEYNKALDTEEVTDRAINLTHEILLKLRAILDQVMYKYFEQKIASNLTDEEKQKARVYFPIVKSDQSLKSTLERGKLSKIDVEEPEIYNFIRSVQPYVSSHNRWLELLSMYAVEGKHIRLTPQKRIQQKRLNIKSGGSSVSIGEGANIKLGTGAGIFIGGRRIMGGQTINTDSEVIYGDPNLDVSREIWVSFNFEGTNINSLGLCKESLQKSKELVENFTKLF